MISSVSENVQPEIVQDFLCLLSSIHMRALPLLARRGG